MSSLSHWVHLSPQLTETLPGWTVFGWWSHWPDSRLRNCTAPNDGNTPPFSDWMTLFWTGKTIGSTRSTRHCQHIITSEPLWLGLLGCCLPHFRLSAWLSNQLLGLLAYVACFWMAWLTKRFPDGLNGWVQSEWVAEWNKEKSPQCVGWLTFR